MDKTVGQMHHNLERPIETERDDRLLHKELVARLLGALIDPEGRATGIVLGLAGASGSGKSSVLNMVAERTERHHPAAIVVRFNPCLANPLNGLVHAFFAEATAALDASAKSRSCQQPDKLKSLGQTLFRYAKRVAPADNILLCDGGAAAAGLDTLRQSPPAGEALHKMRAELVRELDESGIDVVVVIDEIDRLEEREVAVVARLVRLVANFTRFSYLLAYDPDRIAGALGKNDGDSGRAALETLAHLQVTLPPALPRQVRRLVSQRFGELVDEPDEHGQRLNQLLTILVPGILGTLRDAKRLLAGFEMLHRPLRLEVDEVDLLGWATIQVKYPDVAQTFRNRQEQIVGLASTLFGEALLDRMLTGLRAVAVDVTVKSPRGAAEELWLEECAERLISGPAVRPLQRLMEFLFKTPAESRRDPLNAITAALPLAKTLAFGTLIDAGEADDTAPHPRFADMIGELGDRDSAALTGALREADRNGSLAEYLVALHGCGHRVHPRFGDHDWPLDQIWSGFSDFAEPVPALTDPPRDRPNRRLAKFISGPYLHGFGDRRQFLKPNLDILREWITGGRFALAGHLLEVQMKLELEKPDQPAPIVPFLAAKDIAPLCNELGSACRAALHAGTLLETIADMACLRAILRGAPDIWDDDCRRKLDETLTRPELLDRFIWYCFGAAEPDAASDQAAALVADPMPCAPPWPSD
jgi:KAP-like P-loop domain-containing protein